jgi:hypothetical protein
MKIDPNKRYTSREAAALLEVTEETIKKYCRSGAMQGKQIGPKKRWFVLGSAVSKKRKEWGMD